jgi:hypothetical protein
LLFSAEYRGTQEVYSAQVIACNREKLYHLAEAPSISATLEKVVQERWLQEKDRIVSIREPEQVRLRHLIASSTALNFLWRSDNALCNHLRASN